MWFLFTSIFDSEGFATIVIAPVFTETTDNDLIIAFPVGSKKGNGLTLTRDRQVRIPVERRSKIRSSSGAFLFMAVGLSA